MKILLTITLISFIVASAFDVFTRHGGLYQAHQIEFDSKLNRYEVIVRLNSSRTHFLYGSDYLYKLDSQNFKVVLFTRFKIWRILINKNDDVFVFSTDFFFGHIQERQSVFRISKNQKTNNTKSKNFTTTKLFDFDLKGKYNDTSYFIDRDDFIFFNTKSGVAVLQPGRSSPIWVENLDNFRYDRYAEDEDGTVYLRNGSLMAVITNESKQSLFISGSVEEYEDSGNYRNSGTGISFSKKSEEHSNSEKHEQEEILNKPESGSGLGVFYIVLIAIVAIAALMIIILIIIR